MALPKLNLEPTLRDLQLRSLAGTVDPTDAYDLTHPGVSCSTFPDELLVLIRTLMSDGGQCSRSVSGSRPSASEISGDVAHVLRKLILTRQKDYATTLIEDQALLQDSSVGGRRRMAIEVRSGEKMILKAALKELEKLDYASTSGVDQRIETVPTKRVSSRMECFISKKDGAPRHSRVTKKQA